VQRVARQWLLLLSAAALLFTGTAPAVAGAGARASVAGAHHTGPGDVGLHAALLPRPVDRGATPERPSGLDAAPAAVTGLRPAAVVVEAAGADPAASIRVGSGAWGRAPPAGVLVPHPS
jgi:hypothetical protein